MKRACILALLVSAFMLSGSTKQANAGEYGLQGGMPWFGYGYSGSLYGLGRIPVPPYYALHPPVYYSQPSPRPYGHSPYAWRSPQAEIITPAPQLTINPFYKPDTKKKSAATDKRTAKVVVNRFLLASQNTDD